MRIILPLATLGAVLLLAGCGEDKGAILAQCQLDRPDDVATCMRAKGYEFDPERPDCAWNFRRQECYAALTLGGQIGEITRGE